MIVKKNNKKQETQVTQCDFELQDIELTNIIATLFSKARATNLTSYVHKLLTSFKWNQNRLNHEYFYQSKLKKFCILFLKIAKTN